MNQPPSAPPAVPPETKDWSFVLTTRCGQCGYLATEVTAEQVAGRIRAAAPLYARELALPNATQRPVPTTWSPVEYACHVRTVQRLYAGRVDRMRAGDDPYFEGVNHDEVAISERFDLQDPARVAAEVTSSAAQLAAALDMVTGQEWERTCRKSDGHRFTIDALARYVLQRQLQQLADTRAQVRNLRNQVTRTLGYPDTNDRGAIRHQGNSPGK